MPARSEQDLNRIAEQRERKLRQNRRNVVPTYYNSTLDEVLPISGSTEEAIILLPSGVKSSAVNFLQSFADSGNASSDHNTLLEAYSTQLQANSSAVTTELEVIIGRYDNFRKDALTDPDGLGASRDGLSPMLSSMNKALGTLAVKNKREKFYSIWNSIDFSQEIDDQLKRELRSWVRVIVTYP